MALAQGTLLSVNVGAIREFEFNGRVAVSAIWKAPVRGRVTVRGVNLEEGTTRRIAPRTAGPTRRSTLTPSRT